MTFSWTTEDVSVTTFTESPETAYLSSPVFTACGLRWSLECEYKRMHRDEPYIAAYLRLKEPNCVFVAEYFSLRIADATYSTDAKEQTTFANPCENSSPLVGSCWGCCDLVSHEQLKAAGGAEKYLPNGTLTIEVQLRARKHAEVLMPETPPCDLLFRLGALLESAEEADVTFRFAGGSTLSAHSFILALRSSTLKAMLRGPLAISAPYTITVQEDIEPDVMSLLLRFMYTDAGPPSTMTCDEALQLLQAADCYNVERLITLCDLHLRRGMTVENVLQMLVFAHKRSMTDLRAAWLRFIAAHSAQLMADPQWVAMMASHPELVMASMQTIAQGEPPPVIALPHRASAVGGGAPGRE